MGGVNGGKHDLEGLPECWFCPAENLKPFHWESESSDKKMSYAETAHVNGMKCRGGGESRGCRFLVGGQKKECDKGFSG